MRILGLYKAAWDLSPREVPYADKFTRRAAKLAWAIRAVHLKGLFSHSQWRASLLALFAWFSLLGSLGLASPNAWAQAVKASAVAPGVYMVQGESALGSSTNRNFISNAGFVVTDTGVVVIDALGSPALAQELLAEIKRVTPLPVTHVLVTHYHADHIYGLQTFKDAGAQIVAQGQSKHYLNSETARLRLEASRHDLAPWIDETTRLVPADVWFDAEHQLTVGGQRFELRRTGPAHTDEDSVVWIPGLKVLFAGDLVFRGRIPYVGQADSGHWVEALDQLLRLPATVIVPGHGPASTSPREDLTLTRDYLVYLRKTMGKAALAMEAFDEAYRSTDWSHFESLPLFKVANRMNAYNVFLAMEQEAFKRKP